MNRIHKSFAIACATLFSTPALAQPPIVVPFGAPICANGFVGDGEWSQSVPVTVCESVELRAVQDSQYVYLGVRDIDTAHTGLDLYLADSEDPHWLLHISAAHGEQDLRDTAATELRFGVNRLWSANVVQMYMTDGERHTVAPEIFEYQIDKRMIGTDTFRVMLHFKRPETVCPDSADTDSAENWPEFRLNR